MRHFYLVLLMLFLGCGSSESTPAKGIYVDLLRDNAFYELRDQVFESSDELNSFIAQWVEPYGYWNDKSAFLKVLEESSASLDAYNLILYKIVQPSGSISVEAAKIPTIEGDRVIIDITTTAPPMQTADMAYYMLAYLVAKDIKEVEFRHDGSYSDTIANSKESSDTYCPTLYQPVCGAQSVQCVKEPCEEIAQTYSNLCELEVDGARLLFEGQCYESNIPSNCVTWFDGCNRCSIVDGVSACTELYCLLPTGPFECLEFQ